MWLTPHWKAKAKGSYNLQNEKSRQAVILTKKRQSWGNFENYFFRNYIAFRIG